MFSDIKGDSVSCLAYRSAGGQRALLLYKKNQTPDENPPQCHLTLYWESKLQNTTY